MLFMIFDIPVNLTARRGMSLSHIFINNVNRWPQHIFLRAEMKMKSLDKVIILSKYQTSLLQSNFK